MTQGLHLVEFFSCFFFHVLFPFYYLVFSGIMPLISHYYLMVGLDGLGLGLCTLCARSSLGSQAVCLSQMVTTSQQQDETKCQQNYFQSAAQWENWVICIMALCEGYLSDMHLYCKANIVTDCALFPNSCMLENIGLVKTLAIISGVLSTLNVIWGLGIMSSPLYIFYSFIIYQGLRVAAPAIFYIYIYIPNFLPMPRYKN